MKRNVSFPADPLLIDALKHRVDQERQERPGRIVTQSDVIREILHRGLGLGPAAGTQ